MTEVLLRFVLVALVATALPLTADRIQARSRRGVATRLPAGISVVVTPACHLCDALRAQLLRRGVAYTTVDAGDDRLGSLSVRTAPALIRVDEHGAVEAMRVGRSALHDIDDVVVGASGRTGGEEHGR